MVVAVVVVRGPQLRSTNSFPKITARKKQALVAAVVFSSSGLGGGRGAMESANRERGNADA